MEKLIDLQHSDFAQRGASDDNSLTTGTIDLLASSRLQRRDDAYVMRGNVAKRRVDTYHLILAPTHACNLRCTHCYLPDHAPQTMRKQLVLRLIDEWDEIVGDETPGRRGIFHLKGGEPLVYKPIQDVWQRISELKHLQFMMTTNATLFDAGRWTGLSRLNERTAGGVTVVVSLDGVTAKTHELLRGRETFDVTVSAIRELRRRDIRTYINAVLHTDNIHELAQFVEFALEEGVGQLNFLPLVPKGFGTALRARQLQHTDVLARINDIYQSLPSSQRKLLAGSLADIREDERRGLLVAAHECVAAYRGILYVKPNGDAFTCPNLETSQYRIANITKVGLRDTLDRLDALYQRLHADQVSDRYICMGERKLYESLGLRQPSSELVTVSDLPSADLPSPKATNVGFCVSRNW